MWQWRRKRGARFGGNRYCRIVIKAFCLRRMRVHLQRERYATVERVGCEDIVCEQESHGGLY